MAPSRVETRDLIAISKGPLAAEIAPGCGSIASFRHDVDGERTDLFRAACDRDIQAKEPTGMGCFPLVPFSGAIPGGQFHFDGRRHGFPKNHPKELHPTHGDGWLRPWDVNFQGPEKVHLQYRHEPGLDGLAPGFPFAYGATQTFQIDERALRVEISVTNEDRQRVPAGIGLHPYFVKTVDVTLQFSNPDLWPGSPYDADSKAAPTPAHLGFGQERALRDLVLDHGFAGWRNRAIIRWPARGCWLEMAAERPLDLAVVYAPEGADYFCLEPVSNIDDGFNALALGLRGHGVKILEPGETLSASVTFRPRFHRERVDAN